jgi:hypothetical protein
MTTHVSFCAAADSSLLMHVVVTWVFHFRLTYAVVNVVISIPAATAVAERHANDNCESFCACRLPFYGTYSDSSPFHHG